MNPQVLLAGRFDPGEEDAWRAALAAALPEARWCSRADVDAGCVAAAEVVAAVVANPPPGSLQGLPRLCLVQSLWAGVDRLLADPTVPPEVPLARMVDPAMNAAMAETALWAVLSLQRDFFDYAAQQRAGAWLSHPQRRAPDWRVTVLGQGQMGQAVAAALRLRGFAVQGWRRDGRALAPLLAATDVLVNLLPLTPETCGLIDAPLLAQLPPGASLVNLARGAHVVDADLLAALDAGRLRHAVLDVFATEPLPAGHPYWRHPRVTVLPHVAAATDPRSAAAVAAANLRAALAGQPVPHRVERQRGY